MTNLASSLADSLKSESTAELLATIGDVGLDAAIESGALDGVPIFGIATGLWKAGKQVQQELFVRKVSRFLSEVVKTDVGDRRRFLESIEADGKKEEFGETILLILERLDDARKPALVGRVMAAHIRGDIALEMALRLSMIVGRCYGPDLEHLRNFKPGTQGKMTPIAESLFAVGLLSQAGFDGGSAGGDDGGFVYEMNDFGKILIQTALS